MLRMGCCGGPVAGTHWESSQPQGSQAPLPPPTQWLDHQSRSFSGHGPKPPASLTPALCPGICSQPTVENWPEVLLQILHEHLSLEAIPRTMTRKGVLGTAPWVPLLHCRQGVQRQRGQGSTWMLGIDQAGLVLLSPKVIVQNTLSS